MKRIMFFDTETTGLKAGTDQIIQFGATYGVYDPEKKEWHRERTINQFIKPDVEIGKGASDIHGITKEKVANFGKFGDYAREFLAYMMKCDYIVAHNLRFDWSMFKGELKKYPDMLPLLEKVENTTTTMCTMLSYNEREQKQKGMKMKRPKLQELHKSLFDEEFEDAHDALADIEATERCFFELVKREVLQLNLS